jgi:sec-independent protein translocase protein TatC
MTTLPAEDENEIEASRAPLLDHLTELRRRIIVCLVAIAITFGICFSFAGPLLEILLMPFKEAVERVRGPEAVAATEMVFTGAFELFIVKMKIAMFGGLALAFPVIAHQAYRFIAPGLYKRERHAFLPFLVAAPVMFAAGIAFVFYVALPYAMQFALGQEITGETTIRFLPRASEFLGLATTLMLAFGFVFQLPVVFALLGRAGMVNATQMLAGRRYAIVGIFAFSACVTPPDVLSMTIMAIPILLLYEASIIIVAMTDRAKARRAAQDRSADEGSGATI